MRNSVCSEGMCSDTAVGKDRCGFHTFMYILLSGLEVKEFAMCVFFP